MHRYLHRVPRALLVAALLVTAMSGCVNSSKPITFIQLSAAGVAPGTASQPRVLVDSVQVPDFLLRNELPRRVDDNQLRYDSGARWAEPLDLGVQRVIVHRLAAELDSAAVLSFPSGGARDLDWRVDIDLRHLEAGASDARLLADVQIFAGGDGDPIGWQHSSVRPLTSEAPADIAATLSALLAELATDIATRIEEAG